jgi:hypothetical protein
MSKFQMIIYLNFRRIWLNLTPVEQVKRCHYCKIDVVIKIQSLSYGHSGIQLQTVERLIVFIIMTFYLLFIRKDR